MTVNIENPRFDQPREHDGFRALRADIGRQAGGEQGAHQIVNRTEERVRFLALSTSGEPDIILQPDAGKIGALERRPEGGGLRAWFRQSDERPYWEGVEPPG